MNSIISINKQGGSLSAYSLLHHDPYHNAFHNAKNINKSPVNADFSSTGRGNLLIGNINGSVIVYDLEASAVSAVLLSSDENDDDDANEGGNDSSYKGACLQVQLINDEKHVIALTDGGERSRKPCNAAKFTFV